jgi:hypothetical protein
MARSGVNGQRNRLFGGDNLDVLRQHIPDERVDLVYHVSARDVRDLRGVIERERAALGVLITMAEPTRAMRAEAADAGIYTSPWSGALRDCKWSRLLSCSPAGRGPTRAVVRRTSHSDLRRAWPRRSDISRRCLITTSPNCSKLSNRGWRR